tara:strand:+ start:249 stop:950 length:702 start_codon:yes stop_codon:yes gene_type:complete
MALSTFESQINDLIGTFEDQDAMDTFLTDGVKQVISVLPPQKLAQCSTTTTLSNSPSTLDLDSGLIGPVLSVVRKDVNGYNQACRLIPSMLSSRVTDPDDLMHATASDPVYFINNAVLNVYPDPTASQTADIVYVPFPAFVDASDSGSTKIDNFPNDVEYLVVLYAAIKCAQSLLASEEDDDLYIPMINTLKQDYIQGLNLLGVDISSRKEDSDSAQNRKMQAMVNQMLEYGK